MIFSKPIHVLIVVLVCLTGLQISAAVASASLPHVNDCNLCSKCIVDEEPSRKLTSIKDLMVI